MAWNIEAFRQSVYSIAKHTATYQGWTYEIAAGQDGRLFYSGVKPRLYYLTPVGNLY